jgi:hypothetical protein
MDIRELILSTSPAKAPKVEAVDTGEWGTMHVRVMSGMELGTYELEVHHCKDPETGEIVRPPMHRERLLVRTICSPDGSRVFKDSDVHALSTADKRLLFALYEKAREINRMGEEAVEEEKKDSGAIPTSSSGTSSPSKSDAP